MNIHFDQRTAAILDLKAADEGTDGRAN